jgi:hypothetical protein
MPAPAAPGQETVREPRPRKPSRQQEGTARQQEDTGRDDARGEDAVRDEDPAHDGEGDAR